MQDAKKGEDLFMSTPQLWDEIAQHGSIPPLEAQLLASSNTSSRRNMRCLPLSSRSSVNWREEKSTRQALDKHSKEQF
jgi:hypothetical protein